MQPKRMAVEQYGLIAKVQTAVNLAWKLAGTYEGSPKESSLVHMIWK
jgi:hypothetical protein